MKRRIHYSTKPMPNQADVIVTLNARGHMVSERCGARGKKLFLTRYPECVTCKRCA